MPVHKSLVILTPLFVMTIWTTVICQDFDVLVLGAGMAGVTSARTLVELGVDNFLILEGTDRVGGRMKEVMVGDYLLPIGAGWVQGFEGNPVYEMVRDLNLTLIETNYDDWLVYDDSGTDVTLQANIAYARMLPAFDFALEYRKKLLNSSTSDMSVTSAMKYMGWEPMTAIEEACEYFEIDFETSVRGDLSSLEYFFGRNPEFPYEDKEGLVLDQNGGFSQVPKMVLEEVPDWESKTLFNTTVEAIEYSNGGVRVFTNNGQFTAKFAMTTFSLGVLQNQLVSFSPTLPDWKLEAIFAQNFPTYYHIYMRFPEDVDWFVPGNTEWIVYASERRGYYTLWHNVEKHFPGCRIMHGTAINDEARRLDRMADEEIMSEAMAVLRILFGESIPDALEIVMSQWLTDPFTMGSFVDWAVGFSSESQTALKAAVGPVYFSGDAYHDDYGYVHGAYNAAIIQTTKLVECLNDENNCEVYVPPGKEH